MVAKKKLHDPALSARAEVHKIFEKYMLDDEEKEAILAEVTETLAIALDDLSEGGDSEGEEIEDEEALFAEDEDDEREKEIDPDDEIEEEEPEARMQDDEVTDSLAELADGLDQAIGVLQGLVDMARAGGGEADQMPAEEGEAPSPVEMSDGSVEANYVRNGAKTRKLKLKNKIARRSLRNTKTRSELSGENRALKRQGRLDKEVAKYQKRLVKLGCDPGEVETDLREAFRMEGFAGMRIYAKAVAANTTPDPPRYMPDGGAASESEDVEEVRAYAHMGADVVASARELSDEFDNMRSRNMQFSYNKGYFIETNLKAEYGDRIKDRKRKKQRN